jgi:hypothetical protein
MLETRLVCEYWAPAGRGRPKAAIDSAATLAKRERETMGDDDIEFTFSLQVGFWQIRCVTAPENRAQQGADRAMLRDVYAKRKQERSEGRRSLFRDWGDSTAGAPFATHTSSPGVEVMEVSL